MFLKELSTASPQMHLDGGAEEFMRALAAQRVTVSALPGRASEEFVHTLGRLAQTVLEVSHLG